MRQTITHHLLLFFVCVSSFLCMRSFAFYPRVPYDKSLDYFRLLTPGVLFSLYLIFLERRNHSVGKLILFFCLLVVIYWVALEVGLVSWGVAVPIAGAGGALLAKQLLYQRTEWLDPFGRKISAVGFLSALLGLAMFYWRPETKPEGVGFGFIVILWQFAIGKLWMEQPEANEEKL